MGQEAKLGEVAANSQKTEGRAGQLADVGPRGHRAEAQPGYLRSPRGVYRAGVSCRSRACCSSATCSASSHPEKANTSLGPGSLSSSASRALGRRDAAAGREGYDGWVSTSPAERPMGTASGQGASRAANGDGSTRDMRSTSRANDRPNTSGQTEKNVRERVQRAREPGAAPAGWQPHSCCHGGPGQGLARVRVGSTARGRGYGWLESHIRAAPQEAGPTPN